jgi:hypothetical protein
MTHQPQSKQCFTIGNGNYPIDLFIDSVRSAGIDTIIDVRSSPYSRFDPHFNRENLNKSLKERAINYRFMGDQLGGKYTDPSLLFPDGTVNYRKVQDTELFKEAIGLRLLKNERVGGDPPLNFYLWFIFNLIESTVGRGCNPTERTIRYLSKISPSPIFSSKKTDQ